MNSYNGFSPSQRNRAGAWIRAERAAGRLPRPERCVACGSTGLIDDHAEDYSEPFGPHVHAFPLCYRCHMMVHCRHGSGARAFAAYLDELDAGRRWPAMVSRNFDEIRRMLDAGPALRAPLALWIEGDPPALADRVRDGVLGAPSILRAIGRGDYDPRTRK